MVSDTVLGAAIGVSGAMLGSLLTGLFSWISTQQQVDAANQRQRAEFIAERKVDELMELSKELQEVRKCVTEALSDTKLGNEVDLDKLSVYTVQFQEQMFAVQMFLDEDRMEPLYDFHYQLLSAQIYILKNEGEDLDFIKDRSLARRDDFTPELERHASEFEFEDFDEAYKEAREVLRREVAEPIEKLR